MKTTSQNIKRSIFAINLLDRHIPTTTYLVKLHIAGSREGGAYASLTTTS